MSTRERWVVYPLLFLTLGTVMRDKFVPQTFLEVDSLHCNQLDVRKVIHCGQLHARKVDCHEITVTESTGWQEREEPALPLLPRPEMSGCSDFAACEW